MKIKCFYRKNLKLSPEKLAAQIGHITKELGRQYYNVEDDPLDDIIIVLGLSDKKFNEYIDLYTKEGYYYIQVDAGYTEVEKGTTTAFGYIEDL